MQHSLMVLSAAELSVQYWGGHIGTSGQALRVNWPGPVLLIERRR